MEAHSVVEEPVADSIPVLNPSTGETIADVPVTPPDEVAATVARVRGNQPAWEELGFKGRRFWLNKLRDWMFDNADAIGDTMQAETGKVRAEAMNEGIYLPEMVNFYGSKAEKYIGEQKVRPYSPMTATHKMRVQYRPHPVVGLISPWNFPLILSVGDAIPALMAGCAVVLKPSEFTPLGVQQIVEAWKEDLGAPDILDFVVGTADTANALIDDSDFIGFTGSDRVGKLVMARAAQTLTPVSLELGGKDPMIVLEGSNMDRAVNAAAWGGMTNSGQVCMSVERIYVEEPAYDEFVSKLTDSVKELKQGPDGAGFGSDVGAMTSPNQVNHVEDQVEDAVTNGAKVLTGGKRGEGPGDFYEPTVLVDVDHSMKFMMDETFGPVVGVMKVKDSEEAVRLSNDSRYGLSATVFGPSRKAEKVARRIECGAVNVNDVLFNFFAPGVPMGGWKESGIGYRHAEYGIRKYCRSEGIVSARMQAKQEPLWYPYTEKRRAVADKLTRFLSARDMKRRFGKRH
ncbi:MAG: aldehyde dehydrogenase family protein [Solirubrobacterales bacterium]